MPYQSPYVQMLPIKALRAVAYLNRPEEHEDLSIEEYMDLLGLTLGCAGEINDGVVTVTAGTGYQLETFTIKSLIRNIPGAEEHLASSDPQIFAGSGLADQVMAHRAMGQIIPTQAIARETVQRAQLWN